QRGCTDPDRIAVVEPDGAVVRFGELARDARRIANVLESRGMVRGDHIAAIVANSARALAAIAAAYECGLHYTPINFRLTPDEIAYVLADSGARACIADERF